MTPPADPVNPLSQPTIHKRWPAILFIAMVVLIAAVAGLIATGLRDPQPLGAPIAAATPGPRTRSAGSNIEWLPDLLGDELPSAVSLQLTATYVQGEPDSGYGLVYGHPGHALVVAVSPSGYATVWESGGPGEFDLVHLPWQPWPHVRTGQTANELWLDIHRDGSHMAATARVNSEILWQAVVTAPADAAAGLWLGSWGEPVTVDFQTVTVLAP